MPDAKELAETLGLLASCLSIPASDSRHEVNIVKSVDEVERIYLRTLSVLRRFHA